MNHGSNQRNTAAHARIQTRNMKCVLHVSRLHVGLRFLAGAQGVVFEFSFHAIHSIGLKFTIDKYIASIVPLRVLSRTNLAERTSLTSSISFISFRLRTLKLSCRSFSHPDPLFSITSALFSQNTRGGIPLRNLVRCTVAQKCLSVSPLLATLTHSVSRKSFPCHSYANTRDGGVTVAPVSASVSLCLSFQAPSLQPPASRTATMNFMNTKALGLAILCLLPVAAAAQTADEILAKVMAARGGADKLRSIHSERVSGHIAFGEVSGPFVVELERPLKMHMQLTIQNQTMVRVYDGKSQGWANNPFAGKMDPEAMSGDELKNITEESDFDGPLLDYKSKGNQSELVGKDKFDDKDVWRLKLTTKNGDVRYYLFDANSFLLLKWEGKRKYES